MSLSLPPRLCLLLLLALSTPEARADEPLPPPSRWKACSRSGRYCAWMDPEAQRTTVVRVDERGRETPQWEMPGWFRRYRSRRRPGTGQDEVGTQAGYFRWARARR